MAAKIQQRNEIVNQQCVGLQSRLSVDGFRSCILKGPGVAQLYGSLVGLRQSGDIDIWIDAPKEKLIDYVMGIAPTKEVDQKHIHFHCFDDTDVEAHWRPVLWIGSPKNNILQAYFENVREREFSNGGFPTAEFQLIHQLLHTLHEGRLAGVQNKSALHTLVGRFAQLKGDEFNESVRELLKRSSSWHVLDYEPKIEKGRPFLADDNYGDIDVFAYDDKNHIVYNVECKDTSQAKNSREMKVEMDNYLGRYSEDEEKFKKYHEKSLLGKHLRRHKWMVQNAQKVKEFVNSDYDVTIHSILVTSSVLPVTFLRELDLPMPVISYSEIEHNGAEIIVQKCKEFYK